MKQVVITGAQGQLAQAIQQVKSEFSHMEYHFYNRSELDICDRDNVNQILDGINYDVIINTAAYTAVDMAEDNCDAAFDINANGLNNLLLHTKERNATILNYSTDYVFNGKSSNPYKEYDPVQPLNCYGASKVKAEQIISSNSRHYNVRTSWIISPFGNNFVKKMIRLMGERDEILVVNDQIGRPTSALDLARITLWTCANEKNIPFGTYHFANQLKCSWFELAVKIRQICELDCKIIPVRSESMNFKASRPLFSVLSTKKVEQNLNYKIRSWEDALIEIINQLH